MPEDLFKRAFDELSQLSLQNYEQSFLTRLPWQLLTTAKTQNSYLQSTSDYQKILSALDNQSSMHWQNPEIYPYLNYLCRPDNSAPEISLSCLKIHLLIEPFTGSFPIAVPFLRLRAKALLIYRRLNFDYSQVNDLVHQKTSTSPLIFAPAPGLFTDVASDYYRGDGTYSTQFLFNLFSEAMALLDSFCLDLGDRIRRRVSGVAFSPKQRGSAKSYSFRNHYIGGVFVSVSDPLEVAEQILHEYYHQQIWPWWLVERPYDLPDETITIVSPISGATRSVAVMMQAALIYVSIMRFYNYILNRPNLLSEEALLRASRRLSSVTEGSTKLLDCLREALSGKPASIQFVEFVYDVFNSNELPSVE